MWKSFYAGNELLGLPLVTMFLFIAIFAGVVWRVTRPSRRAELEHEAMLPLDDGPPPNRTVRPAAPQPASH